MKEKCRRFGGLRRPPLRKRGRGTINEDANLFFILLFIFIFVVVSFFLFFSFDIENLSDLFFVLIFLHGNEEGPLVYEVAKIKRTSLFDDVPHSVVDRSKGFTLDQTPTTRILAWSNKRSLVTDKPALDDNNTNLRLLDISCWYLEVDSPRMLTR